MHETAVLHFDLSHLSPGQPFTLHAGSRRYELTPHTRDSLARARRANAALGLVPDHRVTHFSGPVRLPGNCPLLLRVTGPKLRDDELLDRLVLTSVHLPRRHRAAALARRRQRQGGPLPPSPKLAALGVTGDDRPLPPDKELIDLGGLVTPWDAAKSLVFHHAELVTMQAGPAADILSWIEYAAGLNDLHDSISGQSQAHENDPSQPNWVSSQPGTDWKTGKPANPVYVWSDQTLEYLALPLKDTLQKTKNDPHLERQCWTVLPGITQLPARTAPTGSQLGDPEAAYTVREVTPQSGVEHDFSYDPPTATATISFKNYYLRWLQISVDQYPPGDDGKPVVPTQTLGELAPVDTIMAVPLPPDWSPFGFTFDEKASRAVVGLGGLGQAPFDLSYDKGGIIWTTLFNYAIPTLFIAFGVAVDQLGKEWTDTCKNVVSTGSTIVEAGAEGPLGGAVSGGVGLTDVLAVIANLAGSFLVGAVAGSDALKGLIAEAGFEGSVEDAEPFVGWVARAIESAADLASMIETTVEVASSPATMAVEIVRTMDVQVTVCPDPRHTSGSDPDPCVSGLWPQEATHYVISITYDDGPVYYYDGPLDPAKQVGALSHTFAGLPAGGTITVTACFYSATGWLAGQGAPPDPLKAQPTDGSTLVVPAFNIKENLVPLTASTTYTLHEKLSFGSQGRTWLTPPAASPPTATVSDLDGSNVGDNLAQLGQLTLDKHATFGYLWRASGQDVPLAGTSRPYTGQEWTFQALGQAAPQSGLKFSDHGYTPMPCLAFPPPTMANPVADGFLLEPGPGPAGGLQMMLRAVSLQPGQPLIAAPGHSFGQFTFPQDDLAIHPAGYAVALNTAYGKLQVLRLTALAADAGAPAAALLSGAGTRPGLLSNPVAVACGLDRIVVLQAGTAGYYPQGSICALDVKGNPVSCFAPLRPFGPAGFGWVTGLHPEGPDTNVVVVDISVESKGYLYVLKYLEPTSGQVLAGDYRLDIYNPDGSFLTQVPGLAAARLQVDLWRNVFTLNYEILQGSGRTEPSVAGWIPSTPGAGTGQTGGN